MAFVDDFADLMTDTVTWQAFVSRDDFGAPTFVDPGTVYKSRVVRGHKLVRNASGDQVVSTTQAWLQGDPDVSPDDRITLPDGSTPVIAVVERFPDDEGDLFTKVYFL